jgi:hypothetical protein
MRLVTERAVRAISYERLVDDDVATVYRARVLVPLSDLRCRRRTLEESGVTLRGADEALAEHGDRGVVPLLVTGVGGAVELARRQARDGGVLQKPAQAKLAVLRPLQTNLSSREREARLFLGVDSRERAVAPWTALGLFAATRPAP